VGWFSSGRNSRVYGDRERNFVGQHFCARGSSVPIVGRGETLIGNYILPRSKIRHRRNYICIAASVTKNQRVIR